MNVFKGRVSYEPNSLDPSAPRESQDRGFQSSARPVEGAIDRVRSESFSDHYSQARLFYRSVTLPEQKHMSHALTFELSKVETEAIRLRMLGHLMLIDKSLGETVSSALGTDGKAEKIAPAKNPIDLEPSPALRLYDKTKPTLEGRKVGLLLGAGFDPNLKNDLVARIEKENAKAAIITSRIQGEQDAQGRAVPGQMALSGSPSVLFDAVVVLAGKGGDDALANDPNAVAFLTDAVRHCKAIGFTGIPALAAKSQLKTGPGIVDFARASKIGDFISAARQGRFWEREEEQ
jgi:catalase